LTIPKPRAEPDDDDDNNEFVVVWSLQEPHATVAGQFALNAIGNDVEANGLTALYQHADNNNQVLVQTADGAWLRTFYLPSPTTLTLGSKFHIICRSSYYVNVIIPNEDEDENEVRRVNNGEELLLMVLNSNANDGTQRQVWYSENEYSPPPTSAPTSSPTSSPTVQAEKQYELLAGTVLFAQSHIIPSKPEHGILHDNQPHLTALR